jgi:hypothetical protein
MRVFLLFAFGVAAAIELFANDTADPGNPQTRFTIPDGSFDCKEGPSVTLVFYKLRASLYT